MSEQLRCSEIIHSVALGHDGRSPKASAPPRLCALIFGHQHDPHVVQVAQDLNSRGVVTRIFDQYRETAAVTLGAEAKAAWPFVEWMMGFDGAAIWSRVKRPINTDSSAFFVRDYRPDGDLEAYVAANFNRAEWRTFHTALVNILRRRVPNLSVVNTGELTHAAHCKPVQLEIASQVGLVIPTTVIGNSPHQIDGAFGDRILVKPQSGLRSGGRGVPPPSVLPKSVILEHGRAEIAPLIYQDRVIKTHELRVTIVGDEVFSARIDSQQRGLTSLDWRPGSSIDSMFSTSDISVELRRMLLSYMKEMELQYGAFDLAVDADGVPVFFECNPAGQWLWLEVALGFPIQNAVVRMIEATALHGMERVLAKKIV